MAARSHRFFGRVDQQRCLLAEAREAPADATVARIETPMSGHRPPPAGSIAHLIFRDPETDLER
jgi:hypothetical protein